MARETRGPELSRGPITKLGRPDQPGDYGGDCGGLDVQGGWQEEDGRRGVSPETQLGIQKSCGAEC